MDKNLYDWISLIEEGLENPGQLSYIHAIKGDLDGCECLDEQEILFMEAYDIVFNKGE